MKTVAQIKKRIEDKLNLTLKEEKVKDYLENNTIESLVEAFEDEDLSFILSQAEELKLEIEPTYTVKNDLFSFGNEKLDALTKRFKKVNEIPEGLLDLLKDEDKVQDIPVTFEISENLIFFKRKLSQKNIDVIQRVVNSSSSKMVGALGYKTGARLLAIMCLGFSSAACGPVSWSSSVEEDKPKAGIIGQLPDADDTERFLLGDFAGFKREISNISGQSISFDLDLSSLSDTEGEISVRIYGEKSDLFKIIVKNNIEEIRFEGSDRKEFILDSKEIKVELEFHWEDYQLVNDPTTKDRIISDTIKGLKLSVTEVY